MRWPFRAWPSRTPPSVTVTWRPTAEAASLVLICAAVYGTLWLVKGMLPADATAEMWQWLYLGPIFVFPGALAALATLDFDWGPATLHFSCYALVTAFLRWLVGLPPL